jgi:ATP-dependent Clp protease adaptor protein ClpS
MADEQHEHLSPEQPDAHDGGPGTATSSAPAKPKPKRKTKQLPPFKVLLHNDDVNTFEHVIQSIVRLTPLGTEEATIKALEAHESNVALLLVTHLERAELYQEQFTSLSMTVTIEAA